MYRLNLFSSSTISFPITVLERFPSISGCSAVQAGRLILPTGFAGGRAPVGCSCCLLGWWARGRSHKARTLLPSPDPWLWFSTCYLYQAGLWRSQVRSRPCCRPWWSGMTLHWLLEQDLPRELSWPLQQSWGPTALLRDAPGWDGICPCLVPGIVSGCDVIPSSGLCCVQPGVSLLCYAFTEEDYAWGFQRNLKALDLSLAWLPTGFPGAFLNTKNTTLPQTFCQDEGCYLWGNTDVTTRTLQEKTSCCLMLQDHLSFLERNSNVAKGKPFWGRQRICHPHLQVTWSSSWNKVPHHHEVVTWVVASVELFPEGWLVSELHQIMF